VLNAALFLNKWLIRVVVIVVCVLDDKNAATHIKFPYFIFFRDIYCLVPKIVDSQTCVNEKYQQHFHYDTFVSHVFL